MWSTKAYSKEATGEDFGLLTTVASVLLLSVTPGTMLDIEYATGRSR